MFNGEHQRQGKGKRTQDLSLIEHHRTSGVLEVQEKTEEPFTASNVSLNRLNLWGRLIQPVCKNKTLACSCKTPDTLNLYVSFIIKKPLCSTCHHGQITCVWDDFRVGRRRRGWSRPREEEQNIWIFEKRPWEDVYHADKKRDFGKMSCHTVSPNTIPS